MYIFFQILNSEASETLRELSPWSYVIVLLTLGFAGIFIKLYLSEKKARESVEKEFRSYTISTVKDQIAVSKDVISLVTNNKTEVKNALAQHSQSDMRLENLITHMKDQLDRIEKYMSNHN